MENILFKMGKKWDSHMSITYNDGITADQVIASASVPLNFGYSSLEVESYNNTTSSYEKNIRYFWDGGIMSNTPLTQVVLLHRQYWLKRKGFKAHCSKVEYRLSQCSST